MSKALKWSIVALVLVLIAMVLNHGVVVPRFMWESRLQHIQNQYPEQTIEVRRVVLALSLNPKLIISEVYVDVPDRQENVQIAMLRLGVDGVESFRQARIQVDQIAIKGLNTSAQRQADCSQPSLNCTPLLPFALAARAWQSTQVVNPGFWTPELALKKLDVEQALFTVNNAEAQQQITGKVEQLKFHLDQHPGQNANNNQFSLGWQINTKSPEGNNQLYLTMNSQTERGQGQAVALRNLTVELKGQWDGFPWTASAEQDLLVFDTAKTNQGEGAPYLKLNGENLRTYIRRDDEPETHQAAFSVKTFTGGLPGQNWLLNKAEWTYTHEQAQAWTFDARFDAAESLIAISPATIEGSEGVPAEPQLRVLNCAKEPVLLREDKPYWVWQHGWFQVYADHPQDDAALIVCPVQQPSLDGSLALLPPAAGVLGK